MMKKLKFRRKRSEAFLDVLFSICCCNEPYILFCGFVETFIYKQNMDYMAKNSCKGGLKQTAE